MSSSFFSSRHWEVDRRVGGRSPLTVDQLIIFFLSPIAIWLLADGGSIMRWGFVVGLIGQPFWIYATFRARQLGALVVSVLYLAIWIRGIVVHFPGLL